MLYKGIRRGDKTFRHFDFDDNDVIQKNGVWYFKVNYGTNKLEGEFAEDEIGYIRCDEVMALGGKKPNIPGSKPKEEPKPAEPVQEIVQEMVQKKKPGRKPKVEKAEVSCDTHFAGTGYEYYVEQLVARDAGDLQNELNVLGEKGWEMCGFNSFKHLVGNDITIIAIFKRKRG